MILEHKFIVDLPIDEAWAVVTDLPRVASCLPGAKLTESSDPDTCHGSMRIKVGPIAAQYAGTAVFEERDDSEFRAVISATGKDSRGQGTVAATVEARLSPLELGTEVTVETDLAITGKVAQFGRGVIVDVSQSLLNQFQANLKQSLLSGTSGPTAGATDTGSSSAPVSGSKASSRGASRNTSTEPASPSDDLNLLSLVGIPMIRRALPLVATALVTAVVVRLGTRRSSGKNPQVNLILTPGFTPGSSDR